jgi:hypothetical protein
MDIRVLPKAGGIVGGRCPMNSKAIVRVRSQADTLDELMLTWQRPGNLIRYVNSAFKGKGRE